MDDVKHLDVRLNRLHRWHLDGLLLIGDAAHAMSPVGGVGINLAVQDAVAAADRARRAAARRSRVTELDLARVQLRRRLPTVLVQIMQRLVHRPGRGADHRGRPDGAAGGGARADWPVPAAVLPAGDLIGVGFRPEHAPPFARPVAEATTSGK